MKHAVCVFVKTPELSPVKTRLAKSIGEKKAIAFYEKSVLATEKVLFELQNQISNLDIIWAIAEKEASTHPRWSEKLVILQGDGGLGERLNHVDNWAFTNYQSVLFYGADSPHVSAKILSEAYKKISAKKIIVGPCEDGGFYFLLSQISLGEKVWLNTPYSQSNTLQVLKSQILLHHKNIEILEGPMDFDIDTIEEYNRLCERHPNFRV